MIALPRTLIPNEWEKFYRLTMEPIIRFFIRLNIHPNTFTVLGLVLSGVAAIYVSRGALRMAGLVLLLGGICDTIDGSLARASGKVSKFGALFDSTLDRYSEILFFLGMAFFFVGQGWYFTSVAVFLGLSGSMMVSYVRARAEGLGLECKVGMLQRPERIILLSAGALLVPPYTLLFSIWVIAIMANITAVHRIVYVWQNDQAKEISSQNN